MTVHLIKNMFPGHDFILEHDDGCPCAVPDAVHIQTYHFEPR